MWEIAGDTVLAKYFELENIWQKNWIPTDEVVVIKNYWIDGSDRDLTLRVWNADIHGKNRLFAAGEAGGMERWVFALPPGEAASLAHTTNATPNS